MVVVATKPETEPPLAQPLRARSVGTSLKLKSQTTRVVDDGTTPVSMYCVPDDAM